MKIYFEEKQYARCKALGLTEAEIVHILGVSTYKLQDFKNEMDYFNVQCLIEDNEDHAITKKFKKRMNK